MVTSGTPEGRYMGYKGSGRWEPRATVKREAIEKKGGKGTSLAPVWRLSGDRATTVGFNGQQLRQRGANGCQ